MESNNGVYADRTPKEVPFEWKGTIYTFKVREITWSQKNKISSRCLTGINTGGNRKATLDIDLYNKEVLKAVLVDAAGLFDPSDDAEYMKLSDDFGSALEQQIIPQLASSELSEDDIKN